MRLAVDRHAIVAFKCLESHRRGALLAFCRISRDVGRRHKGALEQHGVYARLVLPAVDCHRHLSAVDGFEQCLLVDDASARTVDEQAAAAEAFKETAVGDVPCGVGATAGERCVERYHVCLARHGVKPHKIASLTALTRRIAPQHAHAESLAPARHNAAHVSHTDHAERQSTHVASEAAAYDGMHILRHGRGVASRGVGNVDARVATPLKVDMVGADGGCGYKLHAAAVEQRRVAAGACAHKKCVGTPHGSGSDFRRRQICHLAEFFKQTPDIRDVCLNDYSHISCNKFNRL